MKTTLVFLAAVFFIFFANISVAQEKTSMAIPRSVSYQGYIIDAAKQPVTGNHNISVKLYDSPSGGTLLHTENFLSSVTGGVFSVLLGTNTPFAASLAFDKQYWLGVSVDGGEELSPRTAFTSAPYAIRAGEANALAKNAGGAIRTINGKSGDLVIEAGAGTMVQSNGNTITISTLPDISIQPQGNGNVSAVTGTANQVLVNSTSGIAQGGNIILTTPQNINTTASPSFKDMTLSGALTATSVTLSGKASSAATLSTDPSTCLATKGYVDNATLSAWNINGNGGLSSGNYFGTSDATDLSIRTSATERMKITSDGSLLLSGTSGSIPASGFGTRLMWIPSLGAFRAGKANGTEWNSGNIGSQSVGLGYGVLASGSQSVAMGFFTSAYGMGSTAIGSGVSAFADGATAMGSATQAVGYNSVALGDNCTAWSDDAVAIGSNTSATGFGSLAMGYNTTTTNNYGTAMGKNLTVGLSSFGFNGSTTNTIVNVSGISNLAYFGDVDLAIGNEDNNARSLRFYGKNTSGTLSGAHYTAFKAGIQAANITYTLPTTQGAAGSTLTNNGTGTLSWTSSNAAYASVSAGDNISIPANTNVVKIEDDGDNTTANSLALPSGNNGQILYIVNDDSEATTGDAAIASGATGVFVYADGWHKTN